MRHSRGLIIAIAVISFILSIGAVVYPIISDHIARQQQKEIVQNTTKQMTEVSAEERRAAIAEAVAYNQTLLPGAAVAHDYAAYQRLLNLNVDGIMGVLEIPCIDVTLPVYHGTSSETLQKGIGHLYGSSLPVGGMGSHVAVSGHSGMAGNRMLSDLDQMEKGDLFSFQVMGETFTYQVDQIKIVLPDEVSDLAIDPSRDYATLITCTPFSINTHRLLVRGVRVPTPTKAEERVVTGQKNAATSTWTKQYLRGLLLGGGIGGGMLLLFFLFCCLKKRKAVR